MKEVQDHYFKKAKKDGYVARSAFKLEEIDKKVNLLKSGQKVMDLGCYPGSWMQYISKKVGADGLVVGIDRTEYKNQLKNNMVVLHEDINELDIDTLGQYADSFDVVCSDMAPNTCGIKSVDAERSLQLCQMALYVAEKFLKKGGATVVKVFQGSPLERLVKQMRQEYKVVKRIKPKSSRNESKEIFVVGEGKLIPPTVTRD